MGGEAERGRPLGFECMERKQRREEEERERESEIEGEATTHGDRGGDPRAPLRNFANFGFPRGIL